MTRIHGMRSRQVNSKMGSTTVTNYISSKDGILVDQAHWNKSLIFVQKVDFLKSVKSNPPKESKSHTKKFPSEKNPDFDHFD